MMDIYEVFKQFDALSDNKTSNGYSQAALLEIAWDGFCKDKKALGEWNEKTQLWLTIWRQLSLRTGKAEEAIKTISMYTEACEHNSDNKVSYLHDITDLYMSLSNNDLNNQELNTLFFDSAEKYKEILRTRSEVLSVPREAKMGLLSVVEIKTEEMLTRAIKNSKGLINPDTIECCMAHGQLLESCNDLARALPLYIDAAEGARLLFGDSHERTIYYLDHVGYCHYELEQYELALTYFEESYYWSCKAGRPEFNRANNLVRTLMETNNEDRALDIYREWCRRIPLKKTTDREEIMFHVHYSELLSELGKLETSISIVRTAWKRMCTLFGELDEDSLYLKSTLADRLSTAGRYSESICLLKDICKLGADTEYANTDDYLYTWIKLGFTYVQKGEYAKGISILEENIAKIEQQSAIHKSSHMKALNMLAISYGMLGHKEHVLEIHLRAHEENIKNLGENHFQTLLAKNNISITYDDLAKTAYDKEEQAQYILLAEKYLWDACKRAKMNRGSKDLLTLFFLCNKAALLEKRGDIVNAERLYLKVLKERMELLGEEHPETLEVMSKLGDMYADNMLFDEAEKLVSRCYEVRVSILGEEHPDTMKALMCLAIIYQEQSVQIYINSKNDKEKENARGKSSKALALFANYLHIAKGTIYQAFFIERLSDQVNFINDLGVVISYIFWIRSNMDTFGIESDDVKLYEKIALFKHISYDIQSFKNIKGSPKLRRKISKYQEYIERATLGEPDLQSKINTLRREIWQETDSRSFMHIFDRPFLQTIRQNIGDGVLLDIWVESHTCYLFQVDSDSVIWKELCDNIDINPKDYDAIDYALIDPLSEVVKHYSHVYLCLHDKTNAMPLSSLLSKKSCKEITCIPSVSSLLHNLPDPCTQLHVFIAASKNDPESMAEARIVPNLALPGLSVDVLPLTKTTLNTPTLYGVLHISTHGYYERMNSRTGLMDSYISLDNGDKISASELSALNFDKVDLVFLSACSTGIGRGFQGFGPYSVGRALHLSGARYVLGTLWDVPQAAALIFALEFYTALSNILSYSSALVAAQAKMRAYTQKDVDKLLRSLSQSGAEKNLLRELHASLSELDAPLSDYINWAGFVLYKI